MVWTIHTVLRTWITWARTSGTSKERAGVCVRSSEETAYHCMMRLVAMVVHDD
jgi:hypothetical protein